MQFDRTPQNPQSSADDPPASQGTRLERGQARAHASLESNACRILAEQMRDIMLLIRPIDGRIVDANPAAVLAYGHPRTRLLSMTIADLRTREQAQHLAAQMDQADREGILFETVHVRADGSEFAVEVSARGADFAGERLILSIVRDITQRKAAEDLLRRSHDTFYNLIQNAPFGVYVIDSEFRLAQVSLGSQRVFSGVHPLIGRDFAEVLRTIWVEPFATDAIAKFMHTLATGEPYHAPRTVERRADVDEIEAYDWRIERITLPDGKLGVVCYFYDLSERRRYEAALRETQERHRIAVESAHLGVFEWHIANDVAVWENDRPYEIFGRPRHLGPVGREEFARDFLLPEDREAFLLQSDRDAATLDRACWTLRIRRPDAEVRWIEITGNFTRDRDGTPVRMLGVISDITERVTAELAVREREERFRNLANAMPQLVWTANAKGEVTYYNSQASNYSGLALDETGKWVWAPLLHPDDLDATIAAWNAAVASGATYQCEHRIRMSDGSYRWHLSRAFPSPDAAQWFGTATDVHEIKQTEDALRASQRELARHKLDLERIVQERTEELTRTHDRLRLSERFAMMGTLAAGLGHDLGNLLAPLRVRLESLSRAAVDPQARDDIEAIKTSAEYLRRLAQGLRLLSQDPQREPHAQGTDLHAWWEDVFGLLKSALPRGVELSSALAPGSGIARISRPALTQAVFNILQNAGDAMKDAGRGKVHVSAHTADNHVHLVLADNGPGMDDTVKARCMEPFFTTKARGVSSGLGLVLVDGLIRDAGGRVELHSELGMGTRFTLVLPMATPTGAAQDLALTCLIDVKDARIRSIITSVLRSMSVEPRPWNIRDGRESLAIIDDAAKLAEISSATPALLVASAADPGPHVRVLGERPNLNELQSAVSEILNQVTRRAAPK